MPTLTHKLSKTKVLWVFYQGVGFIIIISNLATNIPGIYVNIIQRVISVSKFMILICFTFYMSPKKKLNEYFRDQSEWSQT